MTTVEAALSNWNLKYMSDELQDEKEPVELAKTDPKAELTGIAKRNACLKPWKKGQSGNPGGRPKKMTENYESMADMVVPNSMLRGRLEHLKNTGVTFGELIAYSMMIMAAFPGKKGKSVSVAAAKEITDRIEGKVPLRLAGADGGAIEVKYTDEERRARLLEIAQKASNEEVIDAEFEDVPTPEPDAIG